MAADKMFIWLDGRPEAYFSSHFFSPESFPVFPFLSLFYSSSTSIISLPILCHSPLTVFVFFALSCMTLFEAFIISVIRKLVYHNTNVVIPMLEYIACSYNF